MIRRITDASDFKLVYENFSKLAEEHPVKHHTNLPFQPHIMWLAWNNENLLINSAVLVASFIDEKNIDALCWFVIGPDYRVDKNIASSYLWVAKDKKNGLKCFNKAIEILKKKKVDVINVGFLVNSPSSSKIEKLLQRKGFLPEDKSYSLNLTH